MEKCTYDLEDIYCAWLSGTAATLSKLSPADKEKMQPIFGQTLEYALDALDCSSEQISEFVKNTQQLPDKVAGMLVKIKECELKQNM
jgi:hypothetical protein